MNKKTITAKELKKYFSILDCGEFGKFELRSISSGAYVDHHLHKKINTLDCNLEEVLSTAHLFQNLLIELSSIIERYDIKKDESIALALNKDLPFRRYKIKNTSLYYKPRNQQGPIVVETDKYLCFRFGDEYSTDHIE